MRGTELPWPERLLARLVLRGRGAEHVVGDLVERYAQDRRSGRSRLFARVRLSRELVATAFHWWSPGATRLRRNGPRHDGAAGMAPGSRGDGLGAWGRDLRVALRSLLRRPGFSVGVALTIGLGIGATTTIFTVVDSVLLRELPYLEAERLVAVGTTFPTREWADEGAGLQHLAAMSVPNVRDLRARATSFELLAATEMSSSILLPDLGEGPEIVGAASVSRDFFALLGISPALGRTFHPSEYGAASGPVFMLSWGAWQRRYGGDPDVVGSELGRVGTDGVIVGVLPRNFEVPEALAGETPDFWLPLQADHDRYASRDRRSVRVLGRLRPGVSVGKAREEGGRVAAELAADFPDGNVYPDGSHLGIGVNGLLDETVGTSGRILRIFLSASGLLLFLAGMNAATLLLARALDRVRELDVRMALGAGRMRVVRLLLAESLLLAGAGGIVGVAIAWVGVGSFLRFAPTSIPRLAAVAIDGRVLLVAAVVSMGVGVTAGILPALRSTAAGPWRGIQGAGSRSTVPGSRLRNTLVGGQVAVAVLLLSGAGLLFNSFVRMVTQDPGFDPDGLISMNVAVKRPDAPPGERAWQAWDLVLAEAEHVPGVVSVAGTSNPPFQSPYWAPRILLPTDTPETWREGIAGYSITPGYLETVGTRLVAGRDVLTSDRAESQPVALVNEAFVRIHLGGRDPLGLLLRHVEQEVEREIEIVGVVEDVVQGRAEDGLLPAIYRPYTQQDWPFVQVVVRTTAPVDEVIPGMREASRRFSPIVPPRDVGAMRDRIAATRMSPRFQTLLVGSFALVALLLAAAGLYGSLAHAVGRRRRELGVRMALGAERTGILRSVVGEGLRIATVGLVLGIAATLASTRVLSSFLYGVEPNDPYTLVGVGAVLLGVSLVACLLPARRATGVDPVEVLRSE